MQVSLANSGSSMQFVLSLDEAIPESGHLSTDSTFSAMHEFILPEDYPALTVFYSCSGWPIPNAQTTRTKVTPVPYNNNTKVQFSD